MSTTLQIPLHFDASSVGKVWRVLYQQRAAEAERWAREHQLSPASLDKKRIGLLLVDCQNTFCIPEFELFVAGHSGQGAVEDNVRLCRFIYRSLAAITRIIATQDTHTAMQIFHPIFWVDAKGEHPRGGQTIISLEAVQTGKWKVNPDVIRSLGVGDKKRIQRYVEHYVRSLQETGKYSLMIWPYHSMRAGTGHALASAVEEAVFFHGIARKSAPRFTEKGSHPLTEHYSVLYPEVRQDEQGAAIALPDRELIEILFGFDALIIAGQAKSHCVAWTIDSLLEEAQSRNVSFAGRIYALEDCMSSVVVPGVEDFTEPADRAFRRFAQAGIHLVKSTEPMRQWPGMNS